VRERFESGRIPQQIFGFAMGIPYVATAADLHGLDADRTDVVKCGLERHGTEQYREYSNFHDRAPFAAAGLCPAASFGYVERNR
jgi:hypothetical protein